MVAAVVACTLIGTAAISQADTPTSVVVTCTDLSTHAQFVLRSTKTACPSGAATEVWHKSTLDAKSMIGTELKTLRVCSSSNPDRAYKYIRLNCPKYEISTDYSRQVALPSTPVISSVEILGHFSIRLKIGSVPLSDSPIAYFDVKNSATGTISRAVATNSGAIQISNLNAGVAYSFSIAAVNVDGSSPMSSLTQPVETLASSEADLVAANTGMVGPGGGTVFYYSSAGFACGPTLSSLCHYQEFAPSNWASTPHYGYFHSVRSAYNAVSVSAFNGFYPTSEVIGGGYPNSLAFIAQNGACSDIATCDYSYGAVAKYSANGFSDWYVPDTLELEQICKFVNGQAWVSTENTCTDAGTPDPTKFETNRGFITSNEANNSMYYFINLANGHLGGTGKPDQGYVIPIRSY